MLRRLYDHSPRLFQTIMLNVVGAQNERKRRGGKYSRILDMLLRMQWLDGETIRKWQLKRFAEIFGEAREHVPYYRRVFDKAGFEPGEFREFRQLGELPVLEKTHLRETPADFVNPRRKIVFKMKTGGTTGAPLVTPYDGESLQWAAALMERFFRSCGICRGDRRVHLTGQQVVPHSEKKVFWRRDYFGHALMLSIHHLADAKMPAYLQGMIDFAPRWVFGYTSFIHEVARWINASNNAGKLRVLAVFPSTEKVTATIREDIQKAFSSHVFDHYGATEGIPLITECPAGRLHIVPESGIFEFVRPDGSPAEPGEPAEMLLTSLRMLSRPLLRYRIDDTAALSKQRCTCGRCWPVIKDLTGRVMEWVVTRDGRRISHFSHQVFKVTHNVRESQVIQHAPDRFEVKIVTYPAYTEDDERFIRRRMEEILGHSAEIDFQYMETIPRSASGKRPAVISHVATQAAQRTSRE